MSFTMFLKMHEKLNVVYLCAMSFTMFLKMHESLDVVICVDYELHNVFENA
jgi:hypothetical protein